MNDRKKIITVLVIFILLVTFPFWFSFGTRVKAPELILTQKVKEAKQCVIANDDMASEHMHLLDLWRHSVVRNAEHVFTNNDGIEYEMSLSNTCLDCHSNKSDFCDKCHNYASVDPYCWDCHIDSSPEGEER